MEFNYLIVNNDENADNDDNHTEAVLFQFSRNPQFLTTGFDNEILDIVSFILRRFFVNRTAKLLNFPEPTKSYFLNHPKHSGVMFLDFLTPYPLQAL